MSEESLEQRLDSLVTQNPGKYEPRVVERVREFIYYVKINPEKRRPYSRILSEFGELRLYFALHEKWQDRSPKEMEESDDPEAAKFYDALSRWFRNKKITGDKRKGMMEELLSSKRNSWENLRSLEDWKKRYQSNGWDGKTTEEIKTEESGSAFYQAYTKWVIDQELDPDKQKELIHELFPRELTDWSMYKTIDDWTAYYEKNPQWHSHSIKQMREDKDSGASRFYYSFRDWARRQAGKDKEKRRELMGKIFKPKKARKPWYSFDTLEAWMDYFKKQEDWQNLSPLEFLKLGRETHSFYKGLYNWAKEVTKDDIERRQLMEKFFDYKVNSWESYTQIEQWIEHFNAHPEWTGKNASYCDDDKEFKKFYRAFYQWTVEQARDHSGRVNEKLRRSLKEMIFPAYFEDWADLRTIDDWIRCYNDHPEWHGLSASEIRALTENKGGAFYQAFCSWLNRETEGNKRQRNALFRKIFSPQMHLETLFCSLEERIITNYEEALSIVNDYGTMKFRRLVSNKNALAVILFPQLLNQYIELRKEVGNNGNTLRSQMLKLFTKEPHIYRASVVLDSLNILKLAKDSQGQYLPKEDYFRFVKELLIGQADEYGAEVYSYLTKGDYSDVSVIEQLVGDSLNPTMRVRMLLATNPALKSNDTLDAFVKFYADMDECVADAAFNNYFQAIVGLPGVGMASTAKLTQHIAVQSVEHEDRQVLSMSAKQFSDKQGKYCPYALITPFVNITTLRDYAAECEEPVVDILKRVNAMMCRLHSEGYAKRKEIASSRVGTEMQRQALEKRFRDVDYNKLFVDELCGEQGMCREGGIFMSAFLRLGIGDWLNNYKAHNASIIHGDCHDENVIMTADEDIGFVDFGWSRVGIPQEDLTRVTSRYRFEGNISLEQELEVVEDYAAKAAERQSVDNYIEDSRNIDNDNNAADGRKMIIDEAKTAYHYATLFHEARICHIYANRMARSSSQANTDGYLKHRSRLVEHALQVFSLEQASSLAASMDFEMILDDNKRKSLPCIVDLSEYAAKNRTAYQHQEGERSSLRAGSSR